MKILGYNASPRTTGNTAWAVNAILESAQSGGAETVMRHSGELDIKPCRGCLGCTRSGGCVVGDDMQTLYAELKQADSLVIGSPVYMGQMSAQAKIFTDRLFAEISPRFSPHFKEENAGKKLVLVFTQGNPDPGKFEAYFEYTKNIFQLLEFAVLDVVVVTGTRNSPANERKELHSRMADIASALTSKP